MIVRPVDGRLAEVTRECEGKTVVCLATGPSITQEQVDRVKGLPAIAVNDAYLLAPWADVLYFADHKWYGWHCKRAEFQSFAGQKVSIQNHGLEVRDKTVLLLGKFFDSTKPDVALSEDPRILCTGSNSGYQALNIATLSGARKVVLLGYDCRDVDGKAHFFGAHPDGTKPGYPSIKVHFQRAAKAAERMGIDVVNCSPGTNLDCFRLSRLEDEL